MTIQKSSRISTERFYTDLHTGLKIPFFPHKATEWHSSPASEVCFIICHGWLTPPFFFLLVWEVSDVLKYLLAFWSWCSNCVCVFISYSPSRIFLSQKLIQANSDNFTNHICWTRVLGVSPNQVVFCKKKKKGSKTENFFYISFTFSYWKCKILKKKAFSLSHKSQK